MRIALVAAALSTTAFAGSAVAEEGGQSDAMTSALAAGYKAAFTCSATFNANQSLAEIEANELTGVYPDYRSALRSTGRAQIDSASKTVSVAYDSALPPRMAVWRPGMGCAQLPIGADAVAADYVPGFSSWPEPTAPDRSTAIGSNVVITSNVAFFERLEVPVTFAFDGQSYGDDNRTSALVIAQNGQIIAERYARGIDAETPQRTWSVAKSIAATMIGVADEQGILELDFPAVIEAWTAGGDPRREITVQNLLQMSSGLDSGESGSRTDRIYFGGQRVIDSAATKSLEAQPGTRWKYANNDTLLAVRALREAMEDDAAYHRFPYEALLLKIGAERTTLETDWNGDYLASSQVWSTARDLTRIGQLYLQDGVWGGERLLPEGWVDFVTTPAPDQPDNDLGYGAQFWLMNNADGVPEDTFAAMGHRGQFIVIVPSKNVVIVRRGYDASGSDGFDIVRFTADILTALEPTEYEQLVDEEGFAVYDDDGEPVYVLTPEQEFEFELKRERERARD